MKKKRRFITKKNSFGDDITFQMLNLELGTFYDSKINLMCLTEMTARFEKIFEYFLKKIIKYFSIDTEFKYLTTKTK